LKKSPIFFFFVAAILGAFLSRFGPFWIGFLFAFSAIPLLFFRIHIIIVLSVFFLGISYILTPIAIPDGTYFIVGKVRQSSGASVNLSDVKLHTENGWIRAESTYVYIGGNTNVKHAPETSDLFMARIEKVDGKIRSKDSFWLEWPSNFVDEFMIRGSYLSDFIYKEFKVYVIGGSDTLASVFLGRRDVSYDLKKMYNDSGYAQIFAVSGANVWIIAIVAMLLISEAFPMNSVKYPLTLLVVLVYGAITGFSIPSFRAVATFGIFSLFKLIDRTQSLLNVVGLVGLIEVIRDGSIIFDPSFQLSYSAVIGMVILIPVLPEFKPRYISNAVNASLAANIGITPFLILNFGKLYVASFPFNTFVVPILMTAVVGMGLIFSLFAVSGLSFVEMILGAAISLPVKAMDWMAYFTRMLPLSTVEIQSKVAVFWITFSILSILLFFALILSKDNRDKYRKSSTDDLSL
jgi:ComEC/Rec2-related protein